MNKKGSLQDIAYIGLVVLFFGIVVLLGFVLQSNINDQFQASSIVEAQGKAASATLTGFFPGVVDDSFLLFVGGIALVTLLLALMVRIHPIFIPFYLIGLTIVIFVSGLMSNIYQEMAANSNVVAYANQLTFISTVLNYLPLILGIFGTMLMVIMYKVWDASRTI